MPGILSPFKAAGRGLNGILNLGTQNALGAVGGDLNQVNPQDRAALRSNFLMSLGRGIQTGDIGGNIQQFQQGQAAPLLDFRAKQAEAARVAQEQEALKQQQAALQQQRQAILQDPSLAPEAKYQALAQMEAGLGNLGGAKQATEIAGSFQADQPKVVGGVERMSFGGKEVLAQRFEDGRVEIIDGAEPPPNIELRQDDTGAIIAVNKSSLKGGEVVAEGKAPEKKYITFERNGQTYYGDPTTGTAQPFVGPDGKPIQEIPKPATSEDRFSDTLRLGQAYTAELKDTTQIVRAYAKLQAAAADPSAAGDLSIIFSYMKMLDPGSTVREGEQATAENARSVPDSIRARWNKVIAGEKLGPDQRADFINKAKALVTSQRGDAERTAGRYRSLANASGLNPDLVTFDPFEGISTGVSDEEFDSLFK